MDNELIDYVTRVSVSTSQIYRNLIPRDEAIQLGWIAFLGCQRRFNGEGSLEGYAYPRIKGAMIDEVRKILNHEDPLIYEDHDTIHYDEYENPVNYWLSGVEDDRQRHLMTLHYIEGLTISEISEKTGIVSTTVGMLINKGIRTLQIKHCRTGW